MEDRLGVSYKSLSDWVKRYDGPASQRKQDDDQAAELRKLRAELKRVMQEREISKKSAVSSSEIATLLSIMCNGVLNFNFFLGRSFS